MSPPRNWKELAEALGRHPSQLTRWRRAKWWPKDVTPDQVERVRELALRHVLPAARGLASHAWADAAKAHARAELEAQGAVATAPPPTSSAEAELPELDPAKRALLEQLRSADSAPVEMARASYLLTARHVATEVEHGRATASDLDSMNKALGALRQAEASYLELERRRGELVPRELALATAGALGRRLVQAFDALVAMLPAEVSVWRALGDETLAQAEVRAWVEAQAERLRAALAEELEQLSPGDLPA